MRRGFWFLAGAGVGVYTAVRVRRAVEAFTPDGMRDRLAGLALGARLLGEDVSTAMAEAETDLRNRLGIGLDELGAGSGHHAERLEQAAPPALAEGLSRKGED